MECFVDLGSLHSTGHHQSCPSSISGWLPASALRQQLASDNTNADLGQVHASFDALTGSFEDNTIPLVKTVQATANDAVDRAELARRSFSSLRSSVLVSESS